MMSQTSLFTFHRPELATSYCEGLAGNFLNDLRSGLFLVAPRRTGKSTFLREDLIPALKQRHWTTVYVDLWADLSRDPALLIKSAIKAKINEFSNVVTKLARSSGLEKVHLFGVLSLNLTSPELPAEMTISDAIEALVIAGDAPVAIMIDEAQRAISTEEGMNAMFALKAARDSLNLGGQGQRLAIIMTGSNRDKLAHLALKNTQPFFGSQMTHFPYLDKAFTDAFAEYINPQLAADNQFDKDDMYHAFELVGFKPEVLRSIVGDIALSMGAEHFGLQLKAGAEEIRARALGMMESEFGDLPDIQRAVLETMIEQGKDFTPFSETAKKNYARRLDKKSVAITAVQRALEGLRTKGLVWRSAYGAYALEDESLVEWYRHRA